MSKLNFRLSAIAGTAEQIVLGGAALLTFSFLIRRLGTEDVGLWSLVMVAATVAQFFDLQIANSLMYHVARSEAEGTRDATVRLMTTAIVAIFVLYAAIAAIFYFPFTAMLARIAPHDKAPLAQALSPFVFAYIVISNVGAVVLYALTALHKNYVRSAINMVGSALMVAATFILAPSTGIVAIAWATILQSTFVLIAALAALKSNIPTLPLLFWRIDGPALRELAAYGYRLQLMPLSQLLVEPYTRFLLGIFGSLTQVSYFSLAWRIVSLVRALVAGSTGALAPAFANVAADEVTGRESLYARVNEMLFCLVPIALAGAFGAAPLISEILMGEFAPEFVIFLGLLSFSTMWFVMSLASYQRSIGEGRVKWSVLGHQAQGAINVVLGIALVLAFHGRGAVIAISVASMAGGLVILIGNNAAIYGARSRLFDGPTVMVGCCAWIAAAICNLLYVFIRAEWGFWSASAAMIAAGCAIVAAPLLRHPAIGALLRRPGHAKAEG